MEQGYYERYKRQTWLFQGIGIVLVAAAILINEFVSAGTGAQVWILAGIGFIFLVIGGSSGRPHAIVKAFASLLRNDPTRKNAQEFLHMMDHIGKVGLVKGSRQQVESALAAYTQSSEADESIIKELREAVDAHIRNRIF